MSERLDPAHTDDHLDPSHQGGCLCGAVRYEAAGPLTAVSYCHCGQCRRQHGHVGAYTTAARTGFRLLIDEGLVWYQSSPTARRGFCGRCGSALFWDAPSSPRIDIAVGSVDQPTGLKSDRHIYLAFKGDYHDLADDGLRRYDGGVSAGESG